MAFQYNSVTIQNSATLILAANPARRGCLIANTSAGTVYLGMNASVGTSTGMPLLQNAIFTDSGERDAWRGAIYGVVASATSDCRFWEWEN